MLIFVGLYSIMLLQIEIKRSICYVEKEQDAQ